MAKEKSGNDDWKDAGFVRTKFESLMAAGDMKVTRLIGELLVPNYLAIEARYRQEDPARAGALAANHCCEIMVAAKSGVVADSPGVATYRDSGATGFRDALSQSLASTGGKMFERFTAYAASRSLAGTGWAIWKDTKDISNVLGVSKRELLGIRRRSFGQIIEIELEADFIALRPSAPRDSDILLLNCKTSLKERLHQATMWALLLRASRDPKLSVEMGIEPVNPALLRRCRYGLVTGDFALEQPDLKGTPRKLLQFDFSFFDYTFAAVTKAWNSDFPDRYAAGEEQAPMYRLSALRDVLLSWDSRT